MKFRFASAFFLVLALFAFSTSALPTTPADDLSVVPTEEIGDLGLANLVKRHNFPAKIDDKLIAKVMVQIKAQVYAKVVVNFSATLCEKIKAGLNVSAKILGGVVTLDDLNIEARQSAALKNVKLNIEAKLNAELKANVYADIEVQLRKLCLGKTLTQDQLLKILIDIEAKLKAKLKVELPKLQAKLKVDIKAAIAACIKKLTVKIPPIATITASAKVDVDVALKACLDAAIKACATIDATVAAKALLKAL
ncbi:hypothetical protein EC973_001617 [Apophysomyces ossiformis]|uniref:Uncharacterized protein n=1 Tax=Apophysomyces ossiformis TaxID=679940 RepID=A0A8H7BXX1_9FUNG|nr:hypothetical protein EC973_001617 [Apophysomyces ossiformis]